MNKLTKKSKILIAALVVIAMTLVVAVPLVGAANADPISNTKTFNAQGYAYQTIDNQTVKSPANFTLTLQQTSINGTVKKFAVTDGTVIVNGVTYEVTDGNGGVLTRRHLILLQAQGTNPDGHAVTFKLAARYSWAGGNLYVIRTGAKLQTDNGNHTLLMRTEIRR